MRRLAMCCIVALSFLSFGLNAWETHKTTGAADPSSDTVKSVRWEGATDDDMLKQVRTDLESATEKGTKIKTLRIDLESRGGPVLEMMEIARLVRAASDKGLVVEFHATEVCASGCTFVLAAGTPGHRYISKYALTLVHAPQEDGECIEHADEAKTQKDKINIALFDAMRDAYVRYTGQPPAEVEIWLTCGHEQAGNGTLLVMLRIADVAE